MQACVFSEQPDGLRAKADHLRLQILDATELLLHQPGQAALDAAEFTHEHGVFSQGEVLLTGMTKRGELASGLRLGDARSPGSVAASAPC